MNWSGKAVFAAVLAFSMPAGAAAPGEQLTDAAKEARARSLGHELRCLVCQNQSIDDSDAALARDLRRLVRERITAGDSDQQVLEFLVARYGEFILLRPRFSAQTFLLWTMPLAALLLGGLAARALFRRRDEELVEPQPALLSAEERAVLDDMLSARAGRDADKKTAH